jgi:hypothetical protein
MKAFFFPLVGLLAASLQASEPHQLEEPKNIISRDGSLNISDGSSIYMFNKDGTFFMGPIDGMSGRMIKGTWSLEKGSSTIFVVEGRFWWLNGFSSGDLRTMKLWIYPSKGEHKMTCAVPMPAPLKKSASGLGAATGDVESDHVELAPFDSDSRELTINECYFLIDEITRKTR